MTLTIHQVFAKTDWKLLKQQKALLIAACQIQPQLEGLLNWVDSLQDAAEAEGYPVEWLETEEE